MKRVIVVGMSGSGKTTVAKGIAKKLKLPHVEIDGIYWGENWQEPDTNDFRKRLHSTLDSHTDGWVACGSYFNSSGTKHWTEADTVIFLDLPTRVTYLRLLKRTFK